MKIENIRQIYNLHHYLQTFPIVNCLENWDNSHDKLGERPQWCFTPNSRSLSFSTSFTSPPLLQMSSIPMTSGSPEKSCLFTTTSVCRSTWRTSPQRSRCHRHRRKGKCQKIFQGLGDQLGNAETLPEEHIERRRRGRELGRAEKMFKQVDLKIQAKVMCRDMLYKTIKQVFAWLFCIVFIFVNGLEFTDNSMTIQRRPLFSDRYHRTTITYLFF